jgi:uncharacterized protein
MARPFKCRKVGCAPEISYFKPRGIPVGELEEIILAMDEFEAIRLADLEGLYQEEAAKKMNISRQTFGNVITAAHKKIAESLVKGKALKIEGGVYKMAAMRKFGCSECNQQWEIPYGTGKPCECPQCKGRNLHRVEDDKGCARKERRRGCGRQC